MIRRTVITIAAVGVLAAAGLASAQALPIRETKPPVFPPGMMHRHHHHHSHFFFAPSLVVAPSLYEPCWREVWVETPRGPRLRWVDVCAY